MECGAGCGRVMDVDVDTCALDYSACKQKKKNIHLLSRAMNCRMVPVDFTYFAVGCYRAFRWPLLQLPWPRSTLGCRRRWRSASVHPTTLPARRAATLMPPASTSIPTTPPSTVTLQPGVNVTIPAGSPGVNAVNAANTTGPTATSAPLTITADGVTIHNNNNPTGTNQTGLRIQSSGDATITATNSTINVSGTASDWALYAIVLDGGAPHMRA